jgi:hypothetical protein
LVGQGEGRPFVLILVAREFHSRRLKRGENLRLPASSALRIEPLTMK